MSGVGYEVDDREVQHVVRKFLKKSDNLEPAFSGFGEYMLRVTDDRFSGEHDPEGKPWKKLSPVTLLKKKGSKILTESTNLRGRMVYRTTSKSLILENNVIYAAIHQLGGKAGRNRKVTIPGREYLGVNNEDWTELKEILRDHLVK